MTRQRLGNILIYTTAGLLVASGGLHLSAYAQINALAQSSGVTELHALVPVLWLVMGVDLVTVGLIVGLVAFENSNGGRYVLFAVAICPLGAALLQMVYLGFIAPTALLLLDGAMAIASATVREPRRRRSTTGA